MQYTITANNNDSVKIEAGNWMLAMGKALPFFCVDLVDVGSLKVSPGEDHSVFVEASGVGKTWMIRELPPAIQVVAVSATAEAEPAPPPSVNPVVPSDAPPPPMFTMPVSTLMPLDMDEDDEDEESLAERLFELSMDISGAPVDQACRMSLDLILEFVPASAASVVRGTVNDPALTFVAATGPVADQIVGRQVPFGTGLIGLSFDIGGTLLVGDATSDSRHASDLDRETGFHTMASLCVPLVGSDHRTFGVIQILNPQGDEFRPEHIEAVETVARTLANAIAAHQV